MFALAELWHTKSIAVAARELRTDIEQGLSRSEAARRLRELGPNRLAEGKRISPVGIFINQFKDFMVLVLLATTGISALLGEVMDA